MAWRGRGGYQLFGRTIQMWNTWRRTKSFAQNPWLLDHFDQVRFFPVSHAELAEYREAFPHGRYDVRIEEGVFDWAAEKAAQDPAEVAAGKARQQAAFDAERARWKAEGLDQFVADDGGVLDTGAIPEGCTGVESPVPGNVWKYLVAPGGRVAAGDAIAIVVSMKMEITVRSPAAGILRETRAAPGRTVHAGDILAVLETE